MTKGKPIRWMRSSLDDLRAFPDDARAEIGHGLHEVQCGEHPTSAKPLHGEFSGVSELSADSDDGTTYRSVYTVKLDPFVYVLHCFEKKSKRGIATPKRDLDMIRQRLKEAKDDHKDYLRNHNATKTQD